MKFLKRLLCRHRWYFSHWVDESKFFVKIEICADCGKKKVIDFRCM